MSGEVWDWKFRAEAARYASGSVFTEDRWGVNPLPVFLSYLYVDRSNEGGPLFRLAGAKVTRVAAFGAVRGEILRESGAESDLPQPSSPRYHS